MSTSLENAVPGSGANNSVKRKLKIGSDYVVTKVHGPTPPEIFKHRITIQAQFPDSHLPHDILAVQAYVKTGQCAGSVFYIQARLQLQSSDRVCQCRAYEWPHRLGGGKCFGKEPPPFCGSCGRPTQLHRGRTSFCCRADLYQDANLTQDYTGDSQDV